MAANESAKLPRMVAYRDGLLLRNYAGAVGAISAKWFAAPIQDLHVVMRGAYSETADGACEVALPDDSIAFVKPRPDKANNPMIAREKIAADLGMMLGLPVAPSLIRTPQPLQGWPDYTLLSLNCLPAGRLWASGGDAHVRTFAPGLEALRVFWTWIGDVDHNGHGQNLAYRLGSDGGTLCGFDHAYCLGHDGCEPLGIPTCLGYGTALLPEARYAREAVSARIAALPWDDVISIVERLAPILPEVEQRRILRVLEERRSDLGRLLG